jgi:hypothetical protein
MCYTQYMPPGPKGQKRPADVIGAAIKVAKIATGEIQDTTGLEGKEYASKGGRKGGKAKAKKLSPDERRHIAKKAVMVRWAAKAAEEE